MIANAAQNKKTVADPNAAYESVAPLWERSRAACNGERYVKSYDSRIDNLNFDNLLIPFSPTMTDLQYKFYRAEAEFPGVVAQYAKMIVGGLLRKKPQIELPESVPEDAEEWIINAFTQDDAPLAAFIDLALWEELQTSRAWIYVDYPRIENPEALSNEDFAAFKPYPVLWKAETVINWRVGTSASGKRILTQVILKGFEEIYNENEFHPSFMETVWVHEIVNGAYQIRKFQKQAESNQVLYANGHRQPNTNPDKEVYREIEIISGFMVAGKPLDFIPAWPLCGNFDITEPVLTSLIDKEFALYNKISRRNHLLYGAATYTPVIASDMDDEAFDDIVSAGLGSWLRLRQGDTATVLETPTAALQDMERAIAAGFEEMAKLGIRMLTPETDQSGVALDIRNASQSAQIGTINTKTSNTLSQIIAFMLNWRYGIEVKASEIKCTLSTDFNPTPVGEGWLRLATEWYQNGLIPRSIWLVILKQNDIIPPDYNDEDGQKEITEDEVIVSPKAESDFERELALKTKL